MTKQREMMKTHRMNRRTARRLVHLFQQLYKINRKALLKNKQYAKLFHINTLRSKE